MVILLTPSVRAILLTNLVVSAVSGVRLKSPYGGLCKAIEKGSLSVSRRKNGERLAWRGMKYVGMLERACATSTRGTLHAGAKRDEDAGERLPPFSCQPFDVSATVVDNLTFALV